MQETRHRILEAVADGPVTGPDLAERLDISRAAVWKHIERLREEGIDIESTSSGYELASQPGYGPGVGLGLAAPFEIEYHDRIDSTNRRARELAADGHDSVVVLADEQTGGRGRLEREWVSPSGGIWCSILVRPVIPAAEAPLYTLAAAVATVRAVRETGVSATIKWPNDVLVDGRKLAGILTEMEGEADRVSWLIVGIGINANLDPEELPADTATSIRAERGDINRRSVAQQLLEEFHSLHLNHDRIVPEWREYADTLGRRVRVTTGTRTIVGEAVDISDHGALHIETKAGRETVAAGDCEHLRPAAE